MPKLTGSKTSENLKASFAEAAQASRRYLYFARQADVEGYADAAGMMRDMAEGEANHSQGSLDFLREVGDPVTGFPFGTTQQNLKSAIQDERQIEANKIISGLTQADAFLAGEAVNKILNSKLVKHALEKQTGLILNNLDMSGWRSNKPLRDAVIRQIELMHEDEFKDIHVRFDGQIRQLRSKIEELQTAIKK